jgi:uncharacterized membrane protein
MSVHRGVIAEEKAAHSLERTEPHIASLLRRRTSRNLNLPRAGEEKTFGERTADRVTTAAGSWTFILLFLGFLAIWMTLNLVAAR